MSHLNLLGDATLYAVVSQRMRHPTRLVRSYLNLCGMQCVMRDVYEAVGEASNLGDICICIHIYVYS